MINMCDNAEVSKSFERYSRDAALKVGDGLRHLKERLIFLAAPFRYASGLLSLKKGSRHRRIKSVRSSSYFDAGGILCSC